MKKIFVVFLLVCTLLISFVPCWAEETDDTYLKDSQDCIQNILDYLKISDLQTWMDQQNEEKITDGDEWLVLAFSQYSELDFSSFEKVYANYLENNQEKSASTRLKKALCLVSIGSTNRYISKTIQDSIGEQGLMSFVFGLHVLNNGYQSEKYSKNQLKERLLELQLEDGGWAIMGQYGDVDATSMTLQALAPYSQEETISESIERALSFLSENQLTDGDYSSFGEANPESTAQVLLALSSLGIDASTDSRFIKDGRSLWDGIRKYTLPDGSISHKADGTPNTMSMVQVLSAMISYVRFKNGQSSFYILDNARPDAVEPYSTTTQESEEPTVSEPSSHSVFRSYKFWACLGIVVLTLLAGLVLFLLKKRNYKNFIALLLIACLAIGVILITNIQSKEDYYNGKGFEKENIQGTVTMTIRCDTVAGKADHIPADGIILDTTEFSIGKDETAYSILVEASRKYKIPFENDGNESMVYISGIQYLYEFDYGEFSGWIFRVNGTIPSIGAGEYVLKDGDKVEWLYSLRLGKDLS